jgi:hypothetical protein
LECLLVLLRKRLDMLKIEYSAKPNFFDGLSLGLAIPSITWIIILVAIFY